MTSNKQSSTPPDTQMSPNSYSVDVIIPVRAREDYDLLRRLKWRTSCEIPENFKFIVIDYGSTGSEQLKIELLCKDDRFMYIYHPHKNESWNASKARNIALKVSAADYILFEDVDLISCERFYHSINKQIKSLIINGGWEFFVIPVAYLSEARSRDIHSAFSNIEYDDLITHIFDSKSADIEFYAPASSYLLTSRKLALDVGGYDESFEGWGYEDSDFWLKLLRESRLEKPRDFYKLDTRNYSQQVQWRGWRSLFRIYADIIAFKGIYSFHVWHKIADHRSDHVKARNRNIFNENTRYYQSEIYQLPPLHSELKPAHLFLSRNPHSFNKAVFEIFDNPLLIEENTIDPSDVNDIIKTYNVECVIFNNPYGNERRLSLYHRFKESNIKCYVIERGALPWSIYIDEGGFCAESKSYSIDNWQHLEISKEDELDTREYIQELRLSGASLEPQPNIMGGEGLKRRLFGSSPTIKIIFAALQSPSDTTTNFFCGPIGSFDNFITELQQLPSLLPSNWRLVYKNHPLSLEKIKIDGAYCVDDFHIGDILDMCNAVTLINSGVGVLAMVYEKPVFFFGEAFYSCPEINKQVLSATDIVNQIQGKNYYNIEYSFKMLCYLTKRFYSFASWSHEVRKHTDKANLSISKDIKYSVVRVAGYKEKRIPLKLDFEIRQSMLFDRYRLDDFLARKQVTDVKSATTKVGSKNQNISVITPKTKNRFGKTAANINRKFKKLLRDPKLFFLDALKKRVEH